MGLLQQARNCARTQIPQRRHQSDADGDTEADLARRDRLDASRAASPLTQPPDALVLDTTHLDADAVIERVLHAVDETVGGGAVASGRDT